MILNYRLNIRQTHITVVYCHLQDGFAIMQVLSNRVEKILLGINCHNGQSFWFLYQRPIFAVYYDALPVISKNMLFLEEWFHRF